jgi:restriction endonuclease S subunit
MSSKEDIAEQDYILVGERYKEVTIVNTDYPMIELGEICDLLAGNSAPQDKKFFTNGKYPFFRTADVGNVHLSDNLVEAKDYLNDDGINGLKIFPRGTILLPKSGASTFLNHRAILGVDGYVSSHLACIVCDEKKVNNKYLYRVLINIDAKSLTADQGYPSLNIKQISSIKIPLPPLHIQEEIVKEIEGYQKIIDGAKQVVENYKPTIKIDPSWEIKLLEDMVSIKTGKIDSNRAVENGKYPFFTCAKDTYYINEYAFDCEALMLAGNNATADYDVKHYKGKFNAYQRTYVITINDTDIVKYKYLKIIIENNLGNLKRNSIGSQTKYLTLGVIKSLKIPLPTLLVQQQIVEQVNEEMGIVDQNKRLIQIFEQKIKDKISEVWGE